MHLNPNKVVSANSKGVIISFKDVNTSKLPAHINLQVEEVQTQGKVKYQNVHHPRFNKIQQKLYTEAIYGVDFYYPEDIKKMSKKKILSIAAKCAKTQRVINRWKQEIISETVDSFFLSFFPNSRITKAIVQTNGYDRHHRDTHTFKELGLTQKDVAEKLIEVKVLPKNFFELA